MPCIYTAKPIGVRLRPQDRDLILEAAERAGEHLSEFSRRATLARARRILKEAEASGADSVPAARA